MTTTTAPERKRTSCADCHRRRLCYLVPVRGTDLTRPMCAECVFVAAHEGKFS